MHVCRSMLRIHARCIAVSLLFLLGTAGGCKKTTLVVPPGERVLSCAREIDVEPGSVQAVYVCDDPGFQNVTWRPGSNVTSFSVTFATDCPFVSCANISYAGGALPVSTVAPPPKLLKVYKYSISVNGGAPIDPHVVGGGGN
jgi:hypothetical protein